MTEFVAAYDDDAEAAEYVLHLLDDAERQAFESRLATDRNLQVLVREWAARLAPLAADVPEVMPPATVKGRLLHSVDARPVFRRMSAFRTWLAGGVLAAGVMTIVLFGDNFGLSTDLVPAFQAELASEDRSLVMVAGVIPATHEIVIERITGMSPEGRVHELWLIAEGTDAPVSLGVLENGSITRIRVPDDIAPGIRTGTIAVSEEPPGGSPSGMPTGPVVATGQFSDI